MNISQLAFKRIFIFVQLILIAFVSVSTITAQTSSVDLTFNAVVSKDKNVNGNAIQSNFTLQPDGKILTYGNFQVVNGAVKNGIARINADGSVDNSFDCPTCNFVIGSAVVQPDGKIIVAGRTNGEFYTSAVIYRLNADGSRDASFTSPFPAVGFPESNSADVRAVQPDGKVLVILYRYVSNAYNYQLYRLNPNGTIDSSFTAILAASGSGGIFGQFVGKISLLPNGKILVVTNSFANNQGSSPGSATLKRYNADGTSDTTFETPIFTINSGTTNGGASIADFEILSDGSLLAVGRFTAVNGVSRPNIAKILPAGNVDLSFAPPDAFSNIEAATGVEIYSNGKILVSISTIVGAPSLPNRFIRFNADGNMDNTFTSPANLLFVNKFIIDNSDSVLFYGSFTENDATVNKFARLNADGSVAFSFIVNYGIGGSVTDASVQADGKVIIGGDFTYVGNVSRNKVARLNADGSVDQTFNPQTDTNDLVIKIAAQSDGKVLLGGSFTLNSTSGFGLIRLNADGSLDSTFTPLVSLNVLAIVQQPDGKILAGGNISIIINGQIRYGLIRLNSDGTADTSFNAIFGRYTTITSVVLQTDGKILVGGVFSGVNGFNRTNLVRFNADGSLDTAFNAGNIPSVYTVELYPNGKYVAAVPADSNAFSVIRLNNDGTPDAGFQKATFNSIINTLLVQPDGSIIVGGDFTPSRLARLRADGSIDTTFFPVGANNSVRAIVRQDDGKLIVGGDFSMIANVTRLAVARLIITPVRAQVTPFDFDGDGRADLAVFRPSTGAWYELRSQNNAFYALQFGQASDQPAPADYDGDGITDIAVFRQAALGAGDKAAFYIINSSDGAFRPVLFGTPGDVPVSGDWDGDGIADIAVYRNSAGAGGQSYFFYRPSSQPGTDFRAIAWGTGGDVPLRGDFDGDGKLDAAVFRKSNATWYILQSSNNQVNEQPFGISTDIPVPADYDGDGKANLAVYRPSNGFWYIAGATGIASRNFEAIQFGSAEDKPVAADYDGDGKADVAVFRPSNGVWYLLRSSAGFTGVQFGAAEDVPIPNAYVR